MVINIDSILQILGQEGGDLVEVLVIFLIMAISAIGSLVKSKAKNKSGNVRKKTPTSPYSQRSRPTPKRGPTEPPAGRSPFPRQATDAVNK